MDGRQQVVGFSGGRLQSEVCGTWEELRIDGRQKEKKESRDVPGRVRREGKAGGRRFYGECVWLSVVR